MNAAPSSSASPMTPTRQSLASPPCWPLVVSFGGGTNSAAMLIEMARRKVRPDLIMFADTGGELPETIRFVADFSAWLEAHDMPPVVTVREGRQTLEQEVLAANTLPSLAYWSESCWKAATIEEAQRYLTDPRTSLTVYHNKLIRHDGITLTEVQDVPCQEMDVWHKIKRQMDEANTEVCQP
jgi:hypothetical protein